MKKELLDMVALALKSGTKNLCVSVKIVQANPPMEQPSSFSEGTYKTVRVVVENGHVLSASEGSEYYDMFCRVKAGERLTYAWEKQDNARVGKERTSSGSSVIPAYNGNLAGMEIIDWEESAISSKFSKLMERDAKEPKKWVAPAGEDSASPPDYNAEGTATGESQGVVDEKLKSLG